MEILITKHADARIKERVGIKSEQRRKELAEQAFINGIRLGRNCDCKTKKLILKSRKDGYLFVVYRDQLFVFERNLLITVYPAENKYRKTMEAKRAKQHRRVGKAA